MSISNWIGYSRPSWERDEVTPYSLPVILHAERGVDIFHEDALLATAHGVALLLDDDRSAPDEAWGQLIAAWTNGRIRKVARRARASKWDAACSLPGIESTVGTATVRILLPHPLDETPREVSQLQVAGLDLPHNVTSMVPDGDFDLYVAINPYVTMSTGKMMAQVGHAAQCAVLESDEQTVLDWKTYGLGVNFAHWNDSKWDIEVEDAGFTEVEPGTMTIKASFYR